MLEAATDLSVSGGQRHLQWCYEGAPIERWRADRGGGQSLNTGVIDLNLLNACFLDGRARVDMRFIRELIDRNARSPSWLIFAAHDVSDREAMFSCSPSFFTEVVRYAAASGAELLPIGDACARLQQLERVARTSG